MIRTNVVRLAAAVVTLTAVTVGAQQTATLPAAVDAHCQVCRGNRRTGDDESSANHNQGRSHDARCRPHPAFEMVQVAPNKMQMMTTIPGVGAIQVGFDGTTGWSVDPMQGPRVLAGKEAQLDS